MGAPPALPFDVDIERVFVVDLDGDGCADVLYLDDRGERRAVVAELRGRSLRTGAHHLASAGRGHAHRARRRRPRVRCAGRCAGPARRGRAALRVGIALDLVGPQPLRLLTSIDNGVGRRTEIAYTTSAAERRRDRAAGREWPASVPMVLPLVQSTTSVDAATDRTDGSRFEYHDGRYDDVRREFCGFGEVTQTDPGDTHVPTLVTTRRFHVGLQDDGSEPANARERTAARAIRGRLLEQIHSDEEGVPFDRIEHAWETTEGDMEGVVVPRMRRITTSRNDGAPIDAAGEPDRDRDGRLGRGRQRARTSRTQLRRRRAGIRSARSGLASSTRSIRPVGTGSARRAFARTTARGPSSPTRSRSTTDSPSAKWVRPASSPHVTDSRSPTSRRRPCTARSSRTSRQLGYERRDEAAGWWIPLGTYVRTVDAQGVVRGELTGLRGAPSRLALDPTGCYPAEVADAVGNTVSAEFDPRSYQPVRLTAPSGAVSRAEFDALARLTKTVESGDSDADPSVVYEYRTDALPVALTVRRRGADGGPPVEEREFLDGDGRLLERRGRDDTGEVVDASVEYGPTRPAGACSSCRTAPRARNTRQPTPRRRTPSSSTTQAVARCAACDPTAACTRSRTGPDASRRRIPRVVRRSVTSTRPGASVRAEEPIGDRVLVATFTFDVKGNVVEHVDPGGNTTRFAYDLLSRLLRSERPDSTQTVVVDPAGNPVETRAGEHVLLRTFDIANRIVAVRHAANAAPVLQCTYHDNGAPAPADAGTHTAGGRLVRVDDEGGTTVLDYDAAWSHRDEANART